MNQRNIVIATLIVAATLGRASPAVANDPAWRQQVAKLVAANYTYPRSAQVRREEGSAKVKITISGSGKIVSVDLLQPSGSAILDREAIRIPMKVGSFPAPPGGANTVVTVPITWRMG